MPVAAWSDSLGGRLACQMFLMLASLGQLCFCPQSSGLEGPIKLPTACAVKLFPGGLPSVVCLGEHACMLGLCIFASHWLVAEPAAFEGPLTGVLIWSGT